MKRPHGKYNTKAAKRPPLHTSGAGSDNKPIHSDYKEQDPPEWWHHSVAERRQWKQTQPKT
jgi:hypothetical protein